MVPGKQSGGGGRGGKVVGVEGGKLELAALHEGKTGGGGGVVLNQELLTLCGRGPSTVEHSFVRRHRYSGHFKSNEQMQETKPG